MDTLRGNKMAYDSLSLSGRPLTQVGLSVRDLDRARDFYRDVLGLQLLFETNGMLFFQLAGLRLMVGLAFDAAKPIGGSILYFDAPDFEAVVSSLERKGVIFLNDAQVLQRTDTHELKLRSFFDPDGNGLALLGLVQR
jgi:catechol 2,3-dioxygenase-like lactoylglutathione lyase family enzyme